jgi:hypothetical protein
MSKIRIRDLFNVKEWSWITQIDDRRLIEFIQEIDGQWTKWLNEFRSLDPFKTESYKYPIWAVLRHGTLRQLHLLILGGHPLDIYDTHGNHITYHCISFQSYKLMIESGALCLFDQKYIPPFFINHAEYLEYVMSKTTILFDQVTTILIISRLAANVLTVFDKQAYIYSDRLRVILALSRHLQKQCNLELIHSLLRSIHERFQKKTAAELQTLSLAYSFAGLLPISRISYKNSFFVARVAVRTQSFVDALFEHEEE